MLRCVVVRSVRRSLVRFGEAVLVSYGLIRKVWYREIWYGQSRRLRRGALR